MCGIVGAIANRNVIPLLIDGLKRLQYRGYDSAGVAVLNDHNDIKRIRVNGRIADLEKLLIKEPISGQIGIGHTRWATHGKPAEKNAHPHVVGNRLALVHNGIIENHTSLRASIQAKGYQLQSDTDSEVVAWCIFDEINQGCDFLTGVTNTLKKLKGAYAFAIMDAKFPGKIIGARLGAPLIVGIGKGEYYIASDTLALQSVCDQFIYLEDGDIVELSHEDIASPLSNKAMSIYDHNLNSMERKIHTQYFSGDAVEKGEFAHFMLKEIIEQPSVILNSILPNFINNRVQEQAFGSKAKSIFDKVEKVQIVACGTSYHAGLIGRHWLESLLGIPCQVEIASEFRYRKRAKENGKTLYIAISQSGETADTLAALKSINKTEYCGTLGICNVPNSSLVRETDLIFMTNAGPEIGVCSTKAFTTQLIALFLLAILLGRRTDCPFSESDEAMYAKHLLALPELIQKTLDLSPKIQNLAKLLAEKYHALFLGRGLLTPIAQEGALKLKEISYLHAEAYSAGELKHGPLALVDKNMPVVVVAPHDNLIDKLKSNIAEVHAREGELIIFTPASTQISAEEGIHVLEMPEVDPNLSPFIYTVALQLFAYHVAILKGTDVDKPRNLAKSVTVE